MCRGVSRRGEGRAGRGGCGAGEHAGRACWRSEVTSSDAFWRAVWAAAACGARGTNEQHQYRGSDCDGAALTMRSCEGLRTSDGDFGGAPTAPPCFCLRMLASCAPGPGVCA